MPEFGGVLGLPTIKDVDNTSHLHYFAQGQPKMGIPFPWSVPSYATVTLTPKFPLRIFPAEPRVKVIPPA